MLLQHVQKNTAMKQFLIIACLVLLGEITFAQNVSSTDTSRIKPKFSFTPGPVIESADSFHNSSFYQKSIKNVEYQNRGAEDRRDPNSADPNAIPARRVPEQKTLPPTPVK